MYKFCFVIFSHYSSAFEYYNSYPESYPNQSPNENSWKYVETTLVAPTQKTEEWQKFVNSQGITNWDDHLRSQGIDPAEQEKKNQQQGEQWYNPMLDCKQGHSFNGDTAPTPDMKMKYMATPSYPSRTMGVFKCKWTIQRGAAPLLKLIFSMIDFECNGLNPTVKSWGTANHIQITDRGNVKSIYCGKKMEPPFYTDSKEIQVEIQVNTAGFGKRGSRVQIMYQSVRARGTPRSTPKPPPRIMSPKPTPAPVGYTLGPVKAQTQHTQQPQQPQQPLQPRIRQQSHQDYIQPSILNYQPAQTQRPYQQPGNEVFPNEFDPPADDPYQMVGDELESPEADSSSTTMVKSTIGLAVGGVLVLIIIGVALFGARTVKRKITNWRRTPEQRQTPSNVVTFVNELVSSNVKTVSEEPLNQNTLSYTPNKVPSKNKS